MNRSNSWATSLLRTEMRKHLTRLDSGGRDKALRKALEARRQKAGASTQDLIHNPLPWWTIRDAAAHTAWTTAQEPAPVPWELLDCCQQWAAGQPVLLSTSGQEHVAYVRLCDATFTPRWLPPAGAIHQRKVHPAALTTRNPRALWSSAFFLQVGLALLAAQRNPGSWLAGPYTEDEGELQELLETATEELARRSAPALPPSGPVPASPPRPRRGWTRTEVEGLRVPEGVIEPVALSPGK